MKVLFDANVVIDILGATDDLLFSLQALDVSLLRRQVPCVTVSTMPIIQYVLTARKLASRSDSLDALGNIVELLKVLDVTDADLHKAIDEPLGDFEDALIAWTADRHGVDVIVTRDKKGFTGSPVPIMTPRQFCEVYTPSNYEYDIIELEEQPSEGC